MKKFLFRMPPEMHKELALRAAFARISINTLINGLIAEGLLGGVTSSIQTKSKNAKPTSNAKSAKHARKHN